MKATDVYLSFFERAFSVHGHESIIKCIVKLAMQSFTSTYYITNLGCTKIAAMTVSFDFPSQVAPHFISIYRSKVFNSLNLFLPFFGLTGMSLRVSSLSYISMNASN